MDLAAQALDAPALVLAGEAVRAVRGADVAAHRAGEVIVLGLVLELELAPGHDVAEPLERIAGELHLPHEGVVLAPRCCRRAGRSVNCGLGAVALVCRLGLVEMLLQRHVHAHVAGRRATP